MDRQFADKAGISFAKYKSQGFVRVQVANTGSKPFRELRMETDEGGGRLTYIRLALVHPCENLIWPFFFGWWRKRPYLVFRDDQNRWWKLYEARPTIDGANAGV
jgi:hypothetical protein